MITQPTVANLTPFNGKGGGLGVLWADGEPLEGEQRVMVVPLEDWKHLHDQYMKIAATIEMLFGEERNQ